MLVAFDIDGTIDAYPRELGSAMAAFKAAGHTVHVVTGSEATTPEALQSDVARKRDYLAQLGCNSYDRIVCIPRPHAEGKAKYLHQVGAGMLIDNNKKNARASAHICPVLVPWQTRESGNGSADDTGDPTAPLIKSAFFKSVAEDRYTLGLAYPANRADRKIAKDGYRDFASPDAIEKAAWDYMVNSRNVSLWHKAGTDGHGTVVESYIYRGPDWEVNGEIIKSGDWLMGVIWDEATWPLVKAGLIGGLSPEGKVRRRRPSAETLAQLRSS